MFKSIFSKYFVVLSSVIVVSFVAMGGMQMLFSTRYWLQEKQKLLGKSAETVARLTTDNVVWVPLLQQYRIDEEDLAPTLHTLGPSLDSNVLIVNGEGTVILCSESGNCGHLGRTISKTTIESALKRPLSMSTLDDIYAARQYIAVHPILIDINGTSGLLGYVFVSAPADGVKKYLLDNLQIFALSALGVLTLTFIALYAMTYRLVRPLRQMAAATRKFGAGDFSVRVPVHGRDEVAELACSLNNMAVSLSSVEGMRRSFVANVSHELKTPMTTIAGFIDGILDGTIPDEKRSYYLKIVSDEVKRLSRLVRSMLDLSRIDNGEMRLNPVRFDLCESIGTVLLSFEQRIEAKRLIISGMEECPRMEVQGDFDLIGQVVYNLLDNAIKFTNEGGSLGIHLERRDGWIYCAIRNTGSGVPAEEMPHIFERFYKSDKSRSLDKTGVGLGLYIVKSIINLHHGEILVRSAQGEYTEFCFWLPEAPAHTENGQA